MERKFYTVEYNSKAGGYYPQVNDWSINGSITYPNYIDKFYFKKLPDDVLIPTALLLNKKAIATHWISSSRPGLTFNPIISKALYDIVSKNSFGIDFLPVDVWENGQDHSHQYYLTHINTLHNYTIPDALDYDFFAMRTFETPNYVISSHAKQQIDKLSNTAIITKELAREEYTRP